MRRVQLVGVAMCALAVPLFSGGSASAQVTLDPTWPVNPRTFGLEDKNEMAFSGQQTSDGGYVVAASGARGILLVKLDARGSLDPAWAANPRTFHDGRSVRAYCVQQTTDGGYVVGGAIDSSAGGEDAFFLKLDGLGELDRSWDPNPKTFGGAHEDVVYSVQQTDDGGYVATGRTGTFDEGGYDIYLIKLDSEGSLDPAWDQNPKILGGPRHEDSNSVRQTTDGGYIVAGWTQSSGAGGWDAYLIRLDAQGDLDSVWDTNPKTFGGESTDAAWSVQEAADGGYIVVGETRSFGAGYTDAYVLKLDRQGNLDLSWDPNPRTLGDEDHDEDLRSVAVTHDGGYIAVGFSWKERSEDGNVSVYLVKLDSEGELDSAWDPNPRILYGPISYEPRTIYPTSDGGFLVIGSTWSYDTHDRDALVIKLAPSHRFLRGDCDGDGGLSGVPDAMALLNHLFRGSVQPPCLAACDANGDGTTRWVTDAIYILQHAFLGARPPLSPFPTCGPGQLWTDGKPLGCETEPPCQ